MAAASRRKQGAGMTDECMNDQQLLRYSRQIMLQGFDVDGQERLLKSRVLVVGAGGLGSPVALYLAAAGVGELWLADDDRVELSNLQRQIAHTEVDLGENKAASAAEAAKSLNSTVKVRTIEQRLAGEGLQETVAQVDLVLDCSDNFATRFALNRACLAARRPLVSGAAIRAEGQVAVFDCRREDSPCYRCLYDEAARDSQLSCSESGVLAPLVGVVGSMQAVEALKLLVGYGAPQVGKIWFYDAFTAESRTLKLRRDPQCPDCGARAG